MAISDYPPVEYVKQLFRYDDGRLIWNRRPREHFATEGAWKTWNTKFLGKEAGSIHVRGDGKNIIMLIINGIKIKRFHAIWAIHHGEWPIRIDHEDRNPMNDQIGNLRLCTKSQNGANRKINRTSKSGYKGVHWNKKSRKWIAATTANGNRAYIGSFDDPKKAHEAYVEFAEKTWKKFYHDGT